MHAGLIKASRLVDPHRDVSAVGAERLLSDASEMLSGAIVQLSGGAPLTVAVRLMARFQQLSDAPVAWAGDERSLPFPIDLLHAGVELSRLCVIRAAHVDHRMYAVDRLLRTRIASLIVIDRGEDEDPDPGMLGRYMHLCRNSGATVVILTPGDAHALSPAVRLHLRTSFSQEIDTTLSSPMKLEVLRSRAPLRRGSIDVGRPVGMC
ncbi:MAG: hypothetical protein ACOCYB_02135 [Alkalispirochaeta sp.]